MELLLVAIDRPLHEVGTHTGPAELHILGMDWSKVGTCWGIPVVLTDCFGPELVRMPLGLPRTGGPCQWGTAEHILEDKPLELHSSGMSPAGHVPHIPLS